MTTRQRIAGMESGRSSLLLWILLPALVLLAVSTNLSHAADLSVTATLDKATMSVEETAELIVTVNGSGSADLNIPEVDGLEFSQRGQSRQSQIVNGTSSSSLSLTYLIQALRPGKYTIPAFTVQVDGKKLQTEAIPFEVISSPQLQQQGANSSSSQAGLPTDVNGQAAFLHVEVQKQSYVGERIPIIIKAYFPQRLQATVNTLPILKGDGFVMEQLDSHPRQTSENVNSTVYNVLSWNTSLTGIKEGRYPFLLELDATFLVKHHTRSLSPFGDRDPFSDDFFDNFFGGYEKKPIRISTSEAALEILPLPKEHQPQNFTGAIGDFSLQVKAVPTVVEIGQPLKVTMVIEGTGNFDRVEAPDFPDHPGWKSYPPSVSFTSQGSNWQGKKIFEQAVIIKNKAINQIPQPSFSYFDPRKKQYITRSSAPIALEIKASAVEPVPPPATATTAAPESQKTGLPPAKGPGNNDLAPLQQETGAFFQSFTPLFARPWFLGLLALCGFALLVLFGLSLRRRWLERHPKEIRKRQMRQLLDKRSVELAQAIAANDSPAFLFLCRSIIQQQMALLWQVSPEAITFADITTRLGPTSPLSDIFAAAEKSAYAGYALSPATMREYADTLQRECGRLL